MQTDTTYLVFYFRDTVVNDFVFVRKHMTHIQLNFSSFPVLTNTYYIFTLFPIREEKAFFFLKFLKMHMEDTLLQIFIENRVFLPALPCRLVYMRVYNICAFAFLLCCDDLSFSISLSPSPSLTARERGGSERDGGVDAEGGRNGERESGTHERSRQKECP